MRVQPFSQARKKWEADNRYITPQYWNMLLKNKRIKGASQPGGKGTPWFVPAGKLVILNHEHPRKKYS